MSVPKGTVVPDCVDSLQRRPAGCGEKLEPNIDKWKYLHCVKVQDISVTVGC
jgi:hypothetical protein